MWESSCGHFLGMAVPIIRDGQESLYVSRGPVALLFADVCGSLRCAGNPEP